MCELQHSQRLQADSILRGKLASGAPSRGGSGIKLSLYDTFARYLSFVHFAVFCLLSLLKIVVSALPYLALLLHPACVTWLP